MVDRCQTQAKQSSKSDLRLVLKRLNQYEKRQSKLVYYRMYNKIERRTDDSGAKQELWSVLALHDKSKNGSKPPN